MPALPRDGDSSMRRPNSVEQITKQAQDYEYDAHVSLKYWLRSASAMLKQANQYDREGLDEEAYLLLFRHAHLVLSNIPAHPEAKQPANKAAVEQVNAAVKHDLKRMDVLKPRINKRYERWQHIQREREARRSATLEPGAEPLPAYTQFEDNKQALDPREHRELAAQMASKETRRRAESRMPGQFPQDGARDSTGAVLNYHRSRDTAENERDHLKDDLSRRLQEVRARVERPSAYDGTSATISRHADYSYPSVPSKAELSKPWRDPASLQTSIAPPARPPKQQTFEPRSMQPPLIPDKTALSAPLPPPKASTPQPESNYYFKEAASTEAGKPLRTLFLPPTLRHTFLDIARPNTQRNLETCGIIAGYVKSNALFISHLVIPSQNSTTDTCEMEDESALFDYVDEENLMVFGWIHTHPTQTCFMSSRDLHTHSGYQIMLPESIAIVCAPSQHTQSNYRSEGYDEGGDWGCFRLTDPPGLKSILSCTKSGLFHPHEIEDIYTGALRPGHVVEAKNLAFEVVDLRDSAKG